MICLFGKFKMPVYHKIENYAVIIYIQHTHYTDEVETGVKSVSAVLLGGCGDSKFTKEMSECRCKGRCPELISATTRWRRSFLPIIGTPVPEAVTMFSNSLRRTTTPSLMLLLLFWLLLLLFSFFLWLLLLATFIISYKHYSLYHILVFIC